MIFSVLATLGFWLAVVAAFRVNGVSFALAVLAIVAAFACSAKLKNVS